MELARTREAQIRSPQRQEIKGSEQSRVQLEEEAEKENYDKRNFLSNKDVDSECVTKSISCQKQAKILNQETQQTQQSRAITFYLSGNDSPISQTNESINEQIISNSKVSQTPKQSTHQTHNNCFSCDMFKLQLQKDFCSKEIEMNQQHMREKQQMRIQMNKKYNCLWEEHNQQKKSLIHLEHQNKRLSYELEKGHSIVENIKKIKRKQIQKNLESFIKEREEAVRNVQNQLNAQLMKRDQQIQELIEQSEGLNKLIQNMNEERQITQRNSKEKVRQLQGNHQSMINSLKKHYESKFLLIEERHFSQMQTLIKQHKLVEDLLIQQNGNYEIIIREKDQIIEKLLRSIEEFSDERVSNNYFGEMMHLGDMKEESMQELREELKQLREELKWQYHFMVDERLDYLEGKYQSTTNRLKQQLTILTEENQKLRQQMAKKQEIKLQFTEEATCNCDHNIEENYQHPHEEQLKLIIKRNHQLYDRQLNIKQKELSTYQQLIHRLQTQIQTLNQKLQKTQQSHAYLLQSKQRQYQQVLNELNSTEEQLRRKITEQNNQIDELRNILYLLENKIVNDSDRNQCHNPTCKLQLQNLTNLQHQHTKLKQLYQSAQRQIELSSQKLTILQSTLQEQYQNKHQTITDNLIQQLHQTHTNTLQSTKNSYEKLLSVKNQSLSESQQIITNLIKLNYQLNHKCKQAQTDIQKLEDQFYAILTPLLMNTAK